MTKHIILMFIACSIAHAQQQLPGISSDLSKKVFNNEILYSDAIDITRAMNGIDISERGNNFGQMSPAGQKVLREMMEKRKLEEAPSQPIARGQAARAKARAKERAKKSNEAKALMKDLGIDMDAMKIKPGDDINIIRKKMIASNEAQIKLANLIKSSIPFMATKDLESSKQMFLQAIETTEKFKNDDKAIEESNKQRIKVQQDIISQINKEIAKKQKK